MKAKRNQKKTLREKETRYVVKKPSTLKDYIRIYRISPKELKEMEEFEKTLSFVR